MQFKSIDKHFAKTLVDFQEPTKTSGDMYIAELGLNGLTVVLEDFEFKNTFKKNSFGKDRMTVYVGKEVETLNQIAKEMKENVIAHWGKEYEVVMKSSNYQSLIDIGFPAGRKSSINMWSNSKASTIDQVEEFNAAADQVVKIVIKVAMWAREEKENKKLACGLFYTLNAVHV